MGLAGSNSSSLAFGSLRTVYGFLDFLCFFNAAMSRPEPDSWLFFALRSFLWGPVIEFVFAGLTHSLDNFFLSIHFSRELIILILILFIEEQHGIDFYFIFDHMLQSSIGVIFVLPVFVFFDVQVTGSFLLLGLLPLVELVVPVTVVVGWGLGSFIIAGFEEFVHSLWAEP